MLAKIPHKNVLQNQREYVKGASVFMKNMHRKYDNWSK